MKKRLKKDPGMIECGEFILCRGGQTILTCSSCQAEQPLEFETMELFIQHIKDYHPEKIVVEMKPEISEKSIESNKPSKRLGNKKKKSSKDGTIAAADIKQKTPTQSIKIKKIKSEPLKEIKNEIDDNSMPPVVSEFGKTEKIVKKKRMIGKQQQPTKEMPKRQSKISAEQKFAEYSSDDDKPLSFTRNKVLKVTSSTPTDEKPQQIEGEILECKPEINLVVNQNEFFIDTQSKVKRDEQNVSVKIEVKSEDEMDFVDHNTSDDDDDDDGFDDMNHYNDIDSDTSLYNIKDEKLDSNDAKSIFKEEKFIDEKRNQNIDTTSRFDLKSANDDNKNGYICDSCGCVFKSSNNLLKHRKVCGKKDTNASSKKKIKQKIKNESGMFSCSECEEEFDNTTDLAEHEKTHREEKGDGKEIKQCDVCGKHMNANSLKEHLLRHSGVQPFQCSHCPKAFYNKYALQTHEKGHDPNRTRDFQCELCDKNYSRMADLKKHVKYVHLNERPAPCMCDLCGKSFTFRFNLKYHMRRHLNVKPVKCDQCDMTFVERGDLNKHKITHNPNFKPYTCNICNVSFSRKITLTKHQKLHSGLKEYVCKICGKAFAQSPGLYMHMKSHGFNKKPEGAGYYERASHLMFRDMKRDCE